jgi:acylphosphatase
LTRNGETKAVLVRIEGRVQGVFYRGWTVNEANRRGLGGWVRNRRDGSVEALFAGPNKAVDDMVAVCSRGPSAARVTGVSTKAAAFPDQPGFRPLPTE